MGGGIGLDSEPGAGSTFHFTVSVGVASGAARDRVVPEPLRAVSALVVDDNAAARDILVHVLEGVCARVDAVSSGEEAIASVKQHDTNQPYDVIFMDWRMPGLDGIEAAHRIKQDAGLTTHPAVLLVTAFGREEARAEAERVHLDGVLPKPVTASTVVDTLAGLFAGTRQDRTALALALDHDADRLRGIRVLLAEDNEINQQIAVELLEGVGATVEVANDGLEAVHRLLEQPESPNVAVVLMDVQMPEMDGYQATKAIRSDPRYADLPIIAMTAHATMEERQKCLDAGMNGHVSKPIDPAALFETVERFAAARVRGPAVPAAKPAPAAVSDRDVLPAAPGLDVAGGLGRVAGNTKLYRQLLRRFAATQAETFGRMRSALAEGRRPDAERHAHTLKGVAGSLGAHQLEREAGEVEAALRRGVVFPDLAAVIEPAERTLDALVAALDVALPPDVEATIPGAVDPRALRDAVQRLEELLAQDALEAIDVFAAAAPMLKTAFGDRADQIGQLVKDYRFEDALVALRASGSASAQGAT
jgi:two-component system sensor histidine kinase/response regulator